VPIFRRVTKVSLFGPEYKNDLLPHLGKFSDLQELDLVETSISDDDLATWKEQHPRVVVTVTRPVVAR
jgi:hypothetical protein